MNCAGDWSGNEAHHCSTAETDAKSTLIIANTGGDAVADAAADADADADAAADADADAAAGGCAAV